MAERRMFAKTIIDSDAFTDMPIGARLLYYDLAMHADDDGFVNSPKKITSFIGASNDDMNALIAQRFIIPFKSGVVAIRHWRIHNYIRKDTYKETPYKKEKSMLLLDENNGYFLESECPLTDRQQAVNEPSTQDRLGKVRIGKDRSDNTHGKTLSLTENDSDTDIKTKKPIRHKYGIYKNVLLTDEDMNKLKSEFPDDWQNRVERLSEYIASSGKSYKNHLATIRVWAKNDSGHKKRKNEPENSKWCAGNESICLDDIYRTGG